MPSNIEIKARLQHPQRQHALAQQLADGPAEIIQQIDTFFACPHGRLKLREFPGGGAELIFYRRPDQPGPKHSEYQILPIPSPSETRALLATALGEIRTVRKIRTLYMKGQTRIHLDEVEGLGIGLNGFPGPGYFLELEVVMREGQPLSDGRHVADELLAALEVPPDALISGAYADLLGAASKQAQI